MAAPHLLLDKVSLAIGGTKILSEVSFQVELGERVGLIGPNGSGKTTLFNVLSGFLVPQSGVVSLHGKAITNMRPHLRAQKGVGRVFQNFGIFRDMTVLENLVLALESQAKGFLYPFGSRARRIKERASELVDSVGLSSHSNKKASSLSGGQMRLLEISRLLAVDAELLLLDEPTAGVSPKMKNEVEKMLLLLEGLKKTVLVIEHDLSFIGKLCQRAIVLNVGSVILDGPVEDVRHDPLLQEIYFGNGKAKAT
jgi:branched-chain amino acid transport system ATP-binding protein